MQDRLRKPCDGPCVEVPVNRWGLFMLCLPVAMFCIAMVMVICLGLDKP